MASTKKTNTFVTQDTKNLIISQIENLIKQLNEKLIQYKERNNGNEYGVEIIKKDKLSDSSVEYDYVNPTHYLQDDGRQTWERMVDRWGKEDVALWCKITAFKYQERLGKKPNEDVEREKKKIDWYLNKAKELSNKWSF